MYHDTASSNRYLQVGCYKNQTIYDRSNVHATIKQTVIVRINIFLKDDIIWLF